MTTNLIEPPSAVELADNSVALQKRGYALFFLIVVVGGVWTACAPIQSAALASGVVQVEGKTKLIQHLEGGIVSHINVANGDWVNEGDQLLLLDAARDRAEKQILIGRLFNTQATVERLEAERDDRDKIEFSRSLKESAGTDQRAVSAMASEDALFNARFADREGEEAVINSQRAGLEAMAGSTRSILKSLDLEIEDLAALLSDGYVDKQKLRELERARARTLGELADLEVSVDEANLRVVQLRKKFKTQVVHELTEAREELHDLEQQYLAASDRAERATVRAPVAGVVLNLKLSTIGEVIGSGETLMEIVPQVDQLVVDARVTPMDIDRVQVGQSAEVRFAVFKDAYLITGTLTKLSADSLTDEATGETYYAAEIKLLEEDLYLFNNTILVPGMPAEVLIKTGERTMLGYLTSPLNRLFARSLIED